MRLTFQYFGGKVVHSSILYTSPLPPSHGHTMRLSTLLSIRLNPGRLALAVAGVVSPSRHTTRKRTGLACGAHTLPAMTRGVYYVGTSCNRPPIRFTGRVCW